MAVPHDAGTIRRALAIVEASGSLKAASRETGISRSTLKTWREGNLPRGISPQDVTPTAGEVTEAATERANEFRSVAKLYLRHLKKESVISKTSAQQAATVVGIMDDKAVRAEGGPQTTERREIRVIFEVPDLGQISGQVIEGTFSAVEDVSALGDVSSELLDTPRSAATKETTGAGATA